MKIIDITVEGDISFVSFLSPSVSAVNDVEKIAADLRAFVAGNSPMKLVVDFSGVKFFSSQVLGLIVEVWKKLKVYDGRIVICGINPDLSRVFKITNLDSLFDFYPDRDSAVEALKSEANIKKENTLCSSPFGLNAANPSVFWASGDGPYDNTRRALSNIDLSPAKGKRVLLKPNAGRDAVPDSGVTTHPQVVAAAIDAFREAGADVALGESPITGVKALDAFESTGIADIARQRNCPMIDMDARPFVPIDVPDGLAIKSLKLCREVTEYDIVVSIPVMKTHMHTGVTLAIKNMKGCLWRRSKVDLHMLPEVDGIDEKPLDIAIADMTSVLRPHLSIIDGTIGLEGLGPSAGTPKPLGVVVVGVDAFAADSIACEIMGISAADIPYLKMAAARGYGVIDLGKISVSPQNWKDVRSPFELSPTALSLEFPGFNILDKQSCSACQSTLLLFLKQHGEQLLSERKDDKDIAIAIGKGHADLPEGTLCVGNCTAKHRKNRPFVPGCPPVSSEILNEYFKNIKK